MKTTLSYDEIKRESHFWVTFFVFWRFLWRSEPIDLFPNNMIISNLIPGVYIRKKV